MDHETESSNPWGGIKSLRVCHGTIGDIQKCRGDSIVTWTRWGLVGWKSESSLHWVTYSYAWNLNLTNSSLRRDREPQCTELRTSTWRNPEVKGLNMLPDNSPNLLHYTLFTDRSSLFSVVSRISSRQWIFMSKGKERRDSPSLVGSSERYFL